YSVGEERGLHYFVMEYIDGRTLAKEIAARPAFSLEEAVRIVGQVLAALHRIHSAGIVHRDLKPGNIMIDADGRAILLDFGLAKDATAGDLTTAGAIMGTPDYMAPEQIDGSGVGPYTDLYALGVVMYEMLTKVQPFHRRSTVQTLRAHCEEDPPPLSQYRPDLPAAVERLVARAMARQPQDRYQSAAEMAAALLAVCPQPTLTELAELGNCAAQTQKAMSAPAAAALRPPPLWRRAIPAAAVLALALFGGLAMRQLRKPKPNPKPAAPLTAVVYQPQGVEVEPRPIPRPKVRLERTDGSYLDGTLISSQGNVLILEQYPLGNRVEVEAAEIRYLKFFNDWPTARPRQPRRPDRGE
ncbi:MAG: serine/threonine protein kinase, partial [Planctomycetota bacterium]|nr:serine/threonine protein kinase [Planctomycetota bacterium]